MGTTAKRAAVVTLVAGGIVVLALALWKIRVVIALVFLGFIVAAAITSNAAPASERGQPIAIAVAPSTARAPARDNGRTSTIPWRRASTKTCSSGWASMG